MIPKRKWSVTPRQDEMEIHDLLKKKDRQTFAVRAGDATGLGEAGRGRPMTELEIARTLNQDRRQFGEPVSPSSLIKILSKTPIPTTVVGRESGSNGTID